MIREENAHKYIIEKMGYPDDVDLFDLVMSKLLQVDRQDRLDTFQEFISNKLFKENGFECSPLPMSDISDFRKENTTISMEDRELFSDTNNDMMWLCSRLNLDNIVVFLALDLFRHKWQYYSRLSGKHGPHIFGASCVYLANKIVGHWDDIITPLLMDEYSFYRKIKSDDIVNLSYRIFKDEGGIIGKKTLYDYATSLGMLGKAIFHILDNQYYDYNTKEYACFIIDLETKDESNKRKTKNLKKFNILSISRSNW
jgi:hypothetical protein